MKNKLKKYPSKWTLKRSKFVFVLKVIIQYLKPHGNVLYGMGVHYIDGATGNGKTLLMNILRMIILKNGGFGYCNIDEFKNSYQYGDKYYSTNAEMKPFDLEALFENGKQVKKLPKILDGKKCKLLVLDELNAVFNRRSNRSKDYNDIFVPLVRFLLTHRHRLCDKVYLIGQSILLQDTQFQQIVKYRHFVTASKRWRYWFFREQNKMLLLPKKLIIETMIKRGTEPNGNPIWSKPKKMKIKVEPLDIITYDTHAFAKLDDDLPPLF
jgi:hypothetical protein